MDRRKFIDTFSRGGLLASLAVVAGILISRRQVSFTETCQTDFQCRNCQKLSNCALPEAENERDYGEER
jgi:hypothetical protein